MILYRPVSLQELELIYDSGMKAFPARLPKQPIFYPVLQLEYARQTASDWNVKNGKLAGYVTEFKVEDPYISKFKKHKVGGSQHQEFWIPADEVEEFNRHIVGHIKVLEGYFGAAFEGFIPDMFALQGKNAVEQFTLLANSYLYKRMDFYLEIKRNHKAVFLNYPFWQLYEFKNPGLKEKIIQAIKEAWLSSFPKIPLPTPPPVPEGNTPPIKQAHTQTPVNRVRKEIPSVEQADLDEQSSTEPVYEDITLVEQTDSDDSMDLIQEEPTPVKPRNAPLRANLVQDDIPHIEPTGPVAPNYVSSLVKDVTPAKQNQTHTESSPDPIDENTISVEETDSDSWEDLEEDVIIPAKNRPPSLVTPPVQEEITAIGETDLDSLSDLDEEDRMSEEETDSDSFEDPIEEEMESNSYADHANEKDPHREQITSPRFIHPAHKESTFTRQPDSHFMRGVRLGLNEKYPEAIQELFQAIEEDPDHGTAHTSLGVAYRRLGEDDRAFACYETALQIDPRDAEAHYFRANLLYHHGHVREAIEGYTIAFGLAPELIQAQEAPEDRLTDYMPAPAGAHGIARLAQRILDLNRSLEMNPRQANLFKERAAAYSRLWNYEQTIADYTSSLALQPEDARALHARGLAYEQIGQSEQALEDYQRAVAINPQLSDVYIHRGITFGKMRNFRQSIASLTEGIRLSPRNPNGYFNRGVSYFQQRDFASAIDDFSSVIQLAPNYEAAYHWRGIANEEVGRQREAIADYKRFLELSRDPRARAEIEQRLKQSSEGKRNGFSMRKLVQEARQKLNQFSAEETEQNFDLHALIAALGERALHSTWHVSGVNCSGERAEELYAVVDQNKPLPGRELLAIASGISQIKQGDFTAFDPGAASHWILIRAWRGSGFYIEINDTQNKERLRSRFPSMEDVEGAADPYEGLFIRNKLRGDFHFLGG